MVELIDYTLVMIAVSLAVWSTGKYFYNLGKTPKDQPTGCSGCNGSCQPEDASTIPMGLLRKSK